MSLEFFFLDVWVTVNGVHEEEPSDMMRMISSSSSSSSMFILSDVPRASLLLAQRSVPVKRVPNGNWPSTCCKGCINSDFVKHLVLGRELRAWGYLEFFHKELRSYPPRLKKKTHLRENWP